MSFLVLERLTKIYDGVTAVDGISLSVERGEFVSLLGPSGCGKTTLLKIMAGLLPPSAGKVMLADRPVLGPRPDIGMMFQQATLFPWRTTIENILLPIEVRDGKRAAAAARPSAEALLELVGLKGFGTAYPSELSGGMAQRAALARCLARQPQVLLLDEPFGALDEVTRADMQALLVQIVADYRSAAVLVTHDIDEALLVSDRILLLGGAPARTIGEWRIDLPRPREDFVAELGRIRIEIVGTLRRATRPH